jgi:signal transduction histidine kinase
MGKLKREERPVEHDAEWPALAAHIAGGLGHELNGRVTSLLGIAYVARSTRTLDPSLLDDLEEEVQRLRRAAILLRRLPFFASSEPRLDRFSDVVRDAVALHSIGEGTDIPLVIDEPNGDAPQVWLASPDLAKALLLLIAASERSRPTASRTVRVLAPAGDTQSVRIETTGGDAEAHPVNATRSLREGREIVEDLNGGVIVEESTDDQGRHRITITLPVVSPPGFSAGPER